MKNLNYILAFFSIIFFVEVANSQTLFQSVINNSSGYGITKTSDGGYALTGRYATTGSFEQNVYIAKLNSTVNLQWTRTVGDTTSQDGFDIIQTSDGGYAVAGRSNSVGTSLGLVNGYVVRLNNTGNLLWAKNIGGYQPDEFRSIVQSPDGGLIVAGYSGTFCFGIGYADIYVVKLDIITGNILWTKNIGGSGSDYGVGMVQTSDSGLVIAGYTTSFGSGGSDIYCVKLSNTGTLLWTKTIGGSQWDWGYSITKTIDGGFAIAGYTNSFGAGNNDFYIVKLDGNGNLQWTRTVGGTGNDQGTSIVQDLNGDYIIAGYTNSFGAGSDDFYVVKLDNNGNLLWTRTMGATGSEQAWKLIVDTDGGYVVVGTSGSINGGGAYMVKLQSNGNTCSNYGTGGIIGSGGTTSTGGVSGIGGFSILGATSGSGGTITNLCYTTGINSSLTSFSSINISPNPSSGNFKIEYAKTIQQGTVIILNEIGKKVFESFISDESNKIITNENFSPGIYIVKVYDGENYYCKKLIVE